MTEDDTFKRLTRPTYDELLRLYNEWYRNGGFAYPATYRISFVKQYNWTWIEFFNQTAKRNGWDGIVSN